MKTGSASIPNSKSRNCKYAQMWKQGPQVCLTMEIETGSLLNYENGNSNMLNCEKRRSQLWKQGPQVCLTMEIETGSIFNYENRDCKFA